MIAIGALSYKPNPVIVDSAKVIAADEDFRNEVKTSIGYFLISTEYIGGK
jgi:hypothetical protein